MKYIKCLVLIFCLVLCGNSFAVGVALPQSSPQNDAVWGSSSFKADAAKSVAALTAGIDRFTLNFQTKLQPIAMKLFVALTIIAISWAGIKISLSSGSGSLSEPMTLMIRSIFLMGFVYYLLSPDGYKLMVMDFVGGLTDQVALLAMPDGTTTVNGMMDFSNSQMSILTNAWATIRGAGFWSFATNLGGMVIFTILLQIMYAIFAILAFVGFLSAIVSVAIAFSIGPLFIPFLMVEKTSFLFDGWVKFTIAACMTKVIIFILVAIGLFAFDGLAGSGGNVMGTLFLATALGGMLAFHMLNAPQIAQALVSGGAVSFGRLVGQTVRKLTSK